MTDDSDLSEILHQMAASEAVRLAQGDGADELELLNAQLKAAVLALPKRRKEVLKANQGLLACMQGDELAQAYVPSKQLIREVMTAELAEAEAAVLAIREQISDATNRALTTATLEVARETARSSRVTARATVVLAVATIVLIIATIVAALVARGGG